MVRNDWLALMLRIADPVLRSLAERRLHEKLPVEKPDRAMYACLEAFGRTLMGIAPWLELGGLDGEEAVLQKKYRTLVRECIDAATDPDSPDLMNFSEGYGQSLVDAAFLAYAVLRAPEALYQTLDERVKLNLANSLRAAGRFKPFPSNWLFFSAMIETVLALMGEKYDPAPVDYAVRKFEEWYVGDGAYGDGERFHFDYYNSFVIQPMYTDIVGFFSERDSKYSELLPTVRKRASRYAAVLERMIAPDGTYPMIGRSICYRFGAFHALSHAVLTENLPKNISPAQVRCGLSAVIEKTVQGGMFDSDGFLTTGVYGSQPKLGEVYICVGSLYLCEAVFLPLGLVPEHKFWKDADELWTNKKIWSGFDMPFDHAED
ncbi:MAG: DUF2264 domain-containing protein [Oscillospiraceae bacterium]|nr:DUF2264 domain-containing protein [Oscillospiraceae bacterium]